MDFTSDSVTYTYTVPDENSNLSFTFDIVNKSVLAQTISIAEELVGGDEYANAVESVQKAVDRALENAKEVYDDTSSTQAEVNEAWSDLLDALHYLSFEKGDLTELGYLIDWRRASTPMNSPARRWKPSRRPWMRRRTL